MTKPELIASLEAIKARGDDKGGAGEAEHVDADALLVEYIADAEIAEAYSAIGKWYA